MRLIHINKALSRHEKLLIATLSGLFILGAVVHFPDSAYRGLILTTFNFLHFPAFFVLYFIISRILRFQAQISTIGPLLTTIGMAMLLELVQPLVARSASWTDVWVSSAGGLTAFWLMRLKAHWDSARKHSQIKRNLYWLELSSFVLVFSFCSLTLLKPVYSAAYILATKHHAFPELSAHHAPLAYLNWFPLPQGTHETAKLTILECPNLFTAPPLSNESASASTTPSQCIAVKPSRQSWSGLAQILGFDSWQDFDSLELEILADSAFSLTLRIDDTHSGPNYSDRFNRAISLKPGLTSVSIPLADLQQLPKRAPLKLDKIRKLYLFISPSDNPQPFYLRRIFLARATQSNSNGHN